MSFIASNAATPASIGNVSFIPNDGRPNRKRRRITAACLTCRKRKVRCSGEHPGCNTCTENGQSCSGYANEDSRAARRGHRDSKGSDDNRSDSRDSRMDCSSNDVKPGPSSRPGPSTRSVGSRRLDMEDELGSRSPASIPTVGSLTSANHGATSKLGFLHSTQETYPGSEDSHIATETAQAEQQCDYLANRWVNEHAGYTYNQPRRAQNPSDQSNMTILPSQPLVPASTTRPIVDADLLRSMNSEYLPGTIAFQQTPGPRLFD